MRFAYFMQTSHDLHAELDRVSPELFGNYGIYEASDGGVSLLPVLKKKRSVHVVDVGTCSHKLSQSNISQSDTLSSQTLNAR